MAFQACSKKMNDKLDIDSIVPELNSRHLLTQKDFQFLKSQVYTDVDKIHYLLYRLPRNADGWFEKFRESLYQTPTGTGHESIADLLLEELRKLEIQNTDSAAFVSTPVQVSCQDSQEVHLLPSNDEFPSVH